ncbi:MAG: cation transporter [Anaerolineaceae bacterium]|nr:cation transporter [Anaerolineaceae bacterium]
MLWTRPYQPQEGRDKLYWTAIIITIIGNILLAIGKSVAAKLTGSVALYADAANSISDVLYSVLMAFGLWMAIQPPDLSHPQGHSRFEPLVGMAVAFSMSIAGYEAARASIERFITGGEPIALGLPALVLGISALMKAGMFVWIRSIANKVHSPSLNATAADNLSDVLTSSAAFIGIFGALYFTPLLDPIAGMLVALWIFRAAFMTLRENLKYLTGAGAPADIRNKIVDEVMTVAGVLRVHHVITEYAGPQLVVDIHVNVDGNVSLKKAHSINDAVIEKLESIDEVDRAYVHIEPDDWVD